MKIILWNKQWRAVRVIIPELCYLAYFCESGNNVSADILFFHKNEFSVILVFIRHIKKVRDKQ